MSENSVEVCSRLVYMVQRHASIVGKLCPEVRTSGAFHCRHVRADGWLDVHCTTLIGTPTKDKALKYWEFAQEKADRLANHFDEGHLSSYQSRAPEKMRWGGAIRSPGDWVLSFSGFPELMDEAFMLAVVHYAGLMGRKEVVLVANVHGNLSHVNAALDALEYD